MFYKRKDYSKVINWKNSLIEHKYLGDDVKKEKWYHEVDLSKYFANVINAISNEQSLRQVDEEEKNKVKKLIRK